MIIKAGIIGTHGTFKSTLANSSGCALKEEKSDEIDIDDIPF